MPRIKFEFNNSSSLVLNGLLETPPIEQKIEHYAVFAHCFTCGKDIAAATRISRSLAEQGIAVLRFDFTGLGNSDGDFANTNFSSNVDDLLAAAQALERRFQAPALLIGHSLGGAAVLSAAQQLDSVQAIATIGSPATADHVQHLFTDVQAQVHKEGEARVKIGHREFNIKKQLLDDLTRYASATHIKTLRKALLIFHSPQDSIVPIAQAAKIYQAASHPKSFVSLDQADHLLSRKEDAEYVARTLVAWVSRYLQTDKVADERGADSAPVVREGEVQVEELDKKFLRAVYSHRHQLLADEPLKFGGSNLGPSPYDYLLAALGACTSMTIRMYANHKNIPLDDVQVRLKHEKIHASDCADCENRSGRIDRITRHVKLVGKLEEGQRKRLLEIADRCPVHKTLESGPHIETIEER